MRVIGLTGGIASGKSAVSHLLAKWGFPVIDADQVAREVVEPGSVGLKAVRRAFGDQVIAQNGTLDRRKLRLTIAASGEAQQILNEILHPLIRNRIKGELSALESDGVAIAFVEAALLVETGAYRQYDGLLLVTADVETRIRRLQTRDSMSRHDALALMTRQLSDDKKRAVADAQVKNDGTLEDLESNLRRALQKMDIPVPNIESDMME